MEAEILSEVLQVGKIVKGLPEECNKDSYPYYLIDSGVKTENDKTIFNVFSKIRIAIKKVSIPFASSFVSESKEDSEWRYEFCGTVSLSDDQIATLYHK